MKIKGVNELNIKKKIQELYNLQIRKITYLPVGEEGAAYVILSEKEKYFAKVYKKGPSAYIKLKDLKVIMDFLFKTNKIYGINEFPLPLKNKEGKLISLFNGFSIVLYNYIDGVNAKKLSGTDYEKLGVILAKLHNIDKNKFKEIKTKKLDLKWEGKILEYFKELKNNSTSKSSGMEKLKKIFLSYEKTYKEGFTFLKLNVGYIKSKKSNFLITHSDLHSWNIMKEKENIHVIDWDGLQLALPEKDLMCFNLGLSLNKNFEKTYKRNLKKNFRLDKKALKYYKIRRFISDIIFFSRIILTKNSTERETKNYLELIGEVSELLKKSLKE